MSFLNKKKILLSAVILPLLGYAGWFVFRIQEYRYNGWWKPGGYLEDWRNAFCSYDLPSEYIFRIYGHHFFTSGKHLLMYQREDTKQWLILLQLPEHPRIEFGRVRHKPTEDLRAVQPGYSRFPPELGMTPRMLTPLFMTDDIAAGSNGLILRGIRISRQERFTTPAADALYLRGQFSRLGFQKPPRGIWRYPVPVLDFQEEKEGAVAILNDRKTGETIFAIGYIPWNKRFDEEEFKAIVQSVTFEKNPPKNFWDDFPKSQMGITTETQWGPFKSKREQAF